MFRRFVIGANYYRAIARLGHFASPLGHLIIAVFVAVIVYFVLPFAPRVPKEPFLSLLAAALTYAYFSLKYTNNVLRDWEYYRDLLGKVAYEQVGDYYYENLQFIYLIGKSPKADAWIRKYELVGLSNTIKIKDVKFGAAGSNPIQLPFAALGVKAITKDKGRKIYVVPYSRQRETNEWESTVYFDPNIRAGETAKFEISGYWDNLWKDLRVEGYDECRVELTKRAERFEIAITIPNNMKVEFARDPTYEAGATLENCGSRPATFGRTELFCEFSNAVPGFYVLYVRKVRHGS